jgi:tetratricopeptide (TPR) repeat protein
VRDTLRFLLGVERGRTEDMAAQLRASVLGIAPALLPFLPLVGTVVHVDLADTPETAALEHRFRRARLNEVVVELLAAARPGPTVVIIEDAQWMDEATAELLEQLARLTSDLPWLMCLTRREQPGGFRIDDGTVIALGPLPDDEARHLLAAASEAAPLRTHEVEAIVERAGGSPLYLEELLTIARGAGGLERGLPDSLDAVVGAEIDALPPLTRRLLRYASVLGRSFRPEVLREVIAGEDVALDELTREQLTRYLLPDGNERLVFRHGVLRDAAYGGLSYRRRRDLHRRAGDAIERLAQPDPENVADALALHFGLAQDHERTWHYARVAGDRARSTYANIEAQDHYERALDVAQQLDTVAPLQRIEVWTALGDVREQAGLFDAALTAFRRATRLVGDDAVASADLLQRCSRVHERRGAYAAALRLLTEAHRLLEGRHDAEADAARARLLSFGATIRAAQGKPELALAQAEVAVDEARRTGEASALAKAYLVLDWANTQLGHNDAPTHGGEALEIFEQEGDLASQAAVLTNLGCAEYFAGSWDEALELYDRGRAACLRAGNDVQATVAAVNIAEILINQGHLAEAEPMLREAIRVNRASGFLDGVAFSALYLGRLLLQRGDHEDAASTLRTARDHAAALGEKLLALEASVYLAESLTRSGDAPAALAELEEAEARAGGSVAVLSATVERVRAVTLAELDRYAEAETAVRAGLEDARRQGLAYETARLLATSTDLDRRRGRTPDPDDQGEADSLFESLGVRVEQPAITAG